MNAKKTSSRDIGREESSHQKRELPKSVDKKLVGKKDETKQSTPLNTKKRNEGDINRNKDISEEPKKRKEIIKQNTESLEDNYDEG